MVFLRSEKKHNGTLLAQEKAYTLLPKLHYFEFLCGLLHTQKAMTTQ